MLSLFFYQTLGTAHKAWRGGSVTFVYREMLSVDPPLKRAEKASSPPHTSCRIRNNQPFVIVVRSNRHIGMLCNDNCSLETLLKQKSIEKDHVLDNADLIDCITVFQSQHRRGPCLRQCNVIDCIKVLQSQHQSGPCPRQCNLIDCITVFQSQNRRGPCLRQYNLIDCISITASIDLIEYFNHSIKEYNI